jgi:hypothetical protein
MRLTINYLFSNRIGTFHEYRGEEEHCSGDDSGRGWC